MPIQQITADNLVRSVIKIPSRLVNCNAGTIADHLRPSILDAIERYQGIIDDGKSAGPEAYTEAIGRLEAVIDKWGSFYNKSGGSPTGSKPYKARYGFGVVNGDGCISQTYDSKRTWWG